MKNNSSSVLSALAAVTAAKKPAAATVSAHRDLALSFLAEAISGGAKRLLEANDADVSEARKNGADERTLETMHLDYVSVGALCGRIRSMAACTAPTDEREDSVSASGLTVRRVRVPLGVIVAVGGVNPRRTIESAAQIIKTGNVMLLVRSALTPRTDALFEELLASAFSCCALPADTVRGIEYSPSGMAMLLSRDDCVDALLLLAGQEQNSMLRQNTRIPAIYSDTGITHMYVDEGANADAAAAACIDSIGRLQGPELRTVLVNWQASDEFLPALEGRAMAAGVEIVGDARVRSTLHGIEEARDKTGASTEGKLLVLTVNSMNEAIFHIEAHGDGLCDGIFTCSGERAQSFCALVDSGTVAFNTSFSRINGYDAGFGGDVGLSSHKLRDRGPLGLSRLTTTKYIIKG